MSILVVAEHDNSSLKGATLNTLAAAAKMGGDISVLVAGQDCSAVADAAAKAAGAIAKRFGLERNAVYARATELKAK